jgi:hypothetical protein
MKKCTLKRKNFVNLSDAQLAKSMRSPDFSKNDSTQSSNNDDELKSNSSDHKRHRYNLKRKITFDKGDDLEAALWLTNLKRRPKVPLIVEVPRDQNSRIERTPTVANNK